MEGGAPPEGNGPYLRNILCRTDEDNHIDEEIGNRINKANLMYYQICNTIVGHWDVGKATKFHIYKALCLPTLRYVSESWVMFDSTSADHRSTNKILAQSGW